MYILIIGRNYKTYDSVVDAMVDMVWMATPQMVNDTRNLTMLCWVAGASAWVIMDISSLWSSATSLLALKIFSRPEVVETLNGLPRYGLEDGEYSYAGGKMTEDRFGDFVEVTDLAKAFGVVVDKVWDEQKETRCGFAIKQEGTSQ